MHSSHLSTLAFLFFAAVSASTIFADEALRNRIKDDHSKQGDHWIYNDIEKGFAEAKRTGKPLFITFRCVPCEACEGFDAEVAKGSEQLMKLAREKFVCVRQVEMKGVDLSLFQFDKDLSWAAMFLNADRAIYARYGTQSAEGSDAYNSLASLERTMNRVLSLHSRYPGNAAMLKGKTGQPKEHRMAMDMPGLKNKEKYAQKTERQNCIHCHNIHDAEQAWAKKQRRFSLEMMWRYPLPENLGIQIERDDGTLVKAVKSGSPAARAGIRPGDLLWYADGQVLTSIADLQWVLHNLSGDPTTLNLKIGRGGVSQLLALRLPASWKKTDFSWRGSMWSLDPKLGFWAVPVKPEELARLKVRANAFRIKWINNNIPAGREMMKAGFKQNDVLVEYGGKPITMDMRGMNADLRINYKVGQRLPLAVMRGSKRITAQVKLVAND
ncbi:MAG: signaling protein [Opitutales bacterium]|nr:signaling protein [Opitutales bacterium]